MVHDPRLGEEFFALLVGFDAEIARRVAMGGCRTSIPSCRQPWDGYVPRAAIRLITAKNQ